MSPPHVFQAQVNNLDIHVQVTVSYRGTMFSPDIHDMVISRLIRAYQAVVEAHEPDALNDAGDGTEDLDMTFDNGEITVTIETDNDDDPDPAGA